MKREKIAAIFADAQHFTEQEITVCGWVRTVRDMKNFGFIELNDGSCFKSLQVVFARESRGPDCEGTAGSHPRGQAAV